MLLDGKSQHPIFQAQRQTDVLQESTLNIPPNPSYDKDVLPVKKHFIRGIINGTRIRIDFFDSKTVTLGRKDRVQSDLYLFDLDAFHASDNGVSRTHCQLSVKWNQLFVTDLGSTNGTFLDSTRLTPYRPYVIKINSKLSLGKLSIKILAD